MKKNALFVYLVILMTPLAALANSSLEIQGLSNVTEENCRSSYTVKGSCNPPGSTVHLKFTDSSFSTLFSRNAICTTDYSFSTIFHNICFAGPRITVSGQITGTDAQHSVSTSHTTIFSTNRIDSDGDGVDDEVDIDMDGDGILQDRETAQYAPNSSLYGVFTDADSDGTPNYKEKDSDRDGAPDNREAQPRDSFISYLVGFDADHDRDGLNDAYDKDRNSSNAIASVGLDPNVFDADHDNIPDYIDADTIGGGNEPGSVARLSSPLYINWNSFLDQDNIFYFNNQSSKNTAALRLTLLNNKGEASDIKTLSIPPLGVSKIHLYSFKHARDSYGLIKAEFDHQVTPIDGYSSYIRYVPGSKEIEFMLVERFEGLLKGISYAPANSGQPTLNLEAFGDLVYNWVQIENLADISKKFAVDFYNGEGNIGKLPRSTTATPLGRSDVGAGHAEGKHQYLTQIVPEDLNAPYKASLCRYASDAALGELPTGYRFGLCELFVKRDNSDNVLFIPPAGPRDSSYLEIYNLSDQTNNIKIDITKENGHRLPTLNFNLNGRAHVHYELSGTSQNIILPVNSSAVAVANSEQGREFTLRTANYSRDANNIVTAGNTIAPTALMQSEGIVSIFDFSLGQKTEIMLYNTSNGPRNIKIKFWDKEGRFLHEALNVVPGGIIEVINLKDRLPAGSNVDYGAFRLIPSVAGTVAAIAIDRKQSISGNYEDLIKTRPSSPRIIP